MKKILFWLIWILIFLSGPITVIKTASILPLSDTGLIFRFFQRITGLVAFSLIFIQIILGALMSRLTEKLGGWVFKLHLIQGPFIYLLILSHPLLFVVINFKIRGVFDPFYVFSDLCVLCRSNLEFYYSLGRLSFWLITIAVIAAKLRTKPWWQDNWRKFHILNYLAFYLISVHAWQVGSDTKLVPFVWVYWLALVTVTLSVIYKLLPKVSSSFK